MVNFRVRDLDKMAAQLQTAGITVKIDPQSCPIGRFARLHDPEGNPIELWQPKVQDIKGEVAKQSRTVSGFSTELPAIRKNPPQLAITGHSMN